MIFTLSTQNIHSSESCAAILIGSSSDHSSRPSSIPVDVILSITPSEEKAISKYSAGKGYEMNYFLRTKNFLYPINKAEILDLISDLMSALEKLPIFDGVVFRGAPHPNSLLGQLTPVGLINEKSLVVGSTLNDPTFVSATTDISVAVKWYLPNHNDYCLFKIRSKTGKMMPGSLQLNNGEKEVIFLPGTKFKVIGVTEQANGFKLIELREL